MASQTLLLLLVVMICFSFGNTLKFCDAECSERRNTIVIIGRGGLNERLFLYSKMSGVANYLCAQLAIPSPHESLAAHYNRYKTISRNMTWQDFMVMQAPRHHCGDDSIVIQSVSGTSKSGLLVVSNISAAVNCKTQDISFVWVMHDEIVRTPTANLLSNITTYVQNDILSRGISWQLSDLDVTFDMSPFMRNHSKQIIANSNLTMNQFIVFHVRRGDLKRLCNSELEHIPSVLQHAFRNCPFYDSTTNTVSTELSHLPVVFFSDDGNFIYRSEVMRAIREIGFVTSIDGDYVIQQYVQDELSEMYFNNYVTFRIATAIQLYTDKIIQVHGHHGCGQSQLCGDKTLRSEQINKW